MDKFLKNNDFSNTYGDSEVIVDVLIPVDINKRLEVYAKYVEFINTRMDCVVNYTTKVGSDSTDAGLPAQFIFHKNESAMLFKLGTADLQASC